MSLGIAATFRLVGAALQFGSDLCDIISEWALIFGDPAIPTPVLFVIVALGASGCYGQALFVLFAFALLGLGAKGLGFTGANPFEDSTSES